MATLLSGIQPLYTTGAEQGGDPFTGQGAYGLIPSLPKYTTDTAQRIGTDIGSQIRAQAPLFDPTMAAQWQATYEGSRGIIPTDVATNLAIGMAERGVGRGFAPGSPNTNAALARVLGLTSYQIQQNALANAQKLESMIPIQQTDLTTQTRDLSAEIAKLKAAPDPTAAAEEEMRRLGQGLTAGRGGVTAPAAPTMPAAYQMTPTAPATQGVQTIGRNATYPGYIWNPSSGNYEQDPNYWAKQQSPYGYGTPQGDEFEQQWTWLTGEPYSGYTNVSEWGAPAPGGSWNEQQAAADAYTQSTQDLMDWAMEGPDYSPALGDLGFSDWYDPSTW